MLLILISFLAVIGCGVLLAALLVCARGHSLFLGHIVSVIYRIAMGEVAVIELDVDDEG